MAGDDGVTCERCGGPGARAVAVVGRDVPTGRSVRLCAGCYPFPTPEEGGGGVSLCWSADGRTFVSLSHPTRAITRCLLTWACYQGVESSPGVVDGVRQGVTDDAGAVAWLRGEAPAVLWTEPRPPPASGSG